jgi:hypothetical protein
MEMSATSFAGFIGSEVDPTRSIRKYWLPRPLLNDTSSLKGPSLDTAQIHQYLNFRTFLIP